MNNDVTLLVGSKEFKYWTSLEINRHIDSFGSYSFGSPFDPNVPILRDTFKPFSYQRARIEIDNEPIITGPMFVTPEVSAKSATVSCGGYGAPGVLNDCEWPKVFEDVDLKAIADQVAGAFGLPVTFSDSPGAKFDRVACEPNSKALKFLIGLAKQRGLLLTDTPSGGLRFFKPVAGDSVAAIHQDDDRCLSVKPTFDQQKYYSSIRGLSPHSIAKFSEDFEVVNPLLADVYRPHVFTIEDTKGVDIQDLVKAKMGRMYASAAAYSVTVQGWRTDNIGKLWQPGDIVSLLAPGAMVYKEYDFMIKSVALKRATQGGDTATLSLVMPGAYDGSTPATAPWEE